MYSPLEEAIECYRTYEFQVLRHSDNILCCLYKKFRYFGVDILYIPSENPIADELETLRTEYSALGYAVVVKELVDITRLQVELFESFFMYEASVERLKRKYDSFVEKQRRALLGAEYHFVESPYVVSNRDVEDHLSLTSFVVSRLKTARPELVIIEAAAGYGKTCSAYELLHQLLEDESTQCLPLFTELSSNRVARIFKYVLLDVIDEEYQQLHRSIVENEIRTGRVPLVIDGFDELLDKTNTVNLEGLNDFSDVESMLDTIGNLLSGKAKIILTSRSTAIFNGVEFETWLDKWKGAFEVTRISLREPEIESWLGVERASEVRNAGVSIENLSNPVLLSFIRSLPNAEFSRIILQPQNFVRYYFDRLLERERERQDLRLTVDEQTGIFRSLAAWFMEYDISTDTKEYLKLYIKDQNISVLEQSIQLYPAIRRPSLDNLVDILSNHALLDRRGSDRTFVGFVNDFVFGTLIGEVLVEKYTLTDQIVCSPRMLKLASTAFKIQEESLRKQLWAAIRQVSPKCNTEVDFQYDVDLLHSLSQSYEELQIDNVTFRDVRFVQFVLCATVFTSCKFVRCHFDAFSLRKTSFIECEFDACSIENDKLLDYDHSNIAVKCTQKVHNVFDSHASNYEDTQSELRDEEAAIIRIVAEIPSNQSHNYKVVMNRAEKIGIKRPLRYLGNLQSKEYLIVSNSIVHININKIEALRSMGVLK